MGSSSGMKRAAREQAQATREAAAAQAKQSRLQAQAAQQQQEQMIARNRAMDAAKALEENQVKQVVDVDTSPDQQSLVEDPETGRRRAPREAYGVRRPQSGLRV